MSSLRITGGSLRGRRVPVPPTDTRPTAERARQAYFNIAGDRIHGAQFLDLFAGSGIFSLEALSRGAAAAVAVEQSRKGCAAIEAQARAFGVTVRTIAGDAAASLPQEPFDLVYADPPYDYAAYDGLLAAIARLPLPEDALIAIEHRRRTTPFTAMLTGPPAGPSLREIRRAEYGEVWITFFQR